MRLAAALCTWVAGAALACVVAYFGWRVFGPAATHLPVAGPANPAATLVAANLFGGTSAPAAAQGAVLGNDARLLGIIAEPGQRGYALFRLASGPKLVEQGQEIIIARNGHPVAMLVPVPAPRRRPGRLRGKLVMGRDFEAPLPTSLKAAFRGKRR